MSESLLASGPARRRFSTGLALLMPLLAGVWFRSDQLGSQVLIEDEWHALHKLLGSDYADIASHFGYADYSIPLTLVDRLLYQCGLLSENSMHALPWLAGIGLLVVAALIAPSVLTLRTRVVWLWLLALSPLQIYHSRTARPYALTTLLCVVAVVSFWLWRAAQDRAGQGRAGLCWAGAYVVCSALATWLHPIALAFAGMPFLHFGLLALGASRNPVRRSAALRELRSMFMLGVVMLLPVLALLWAPFANDWGSLAAKSGVDQVTLAGVWTPITLWLGTAQAPIVVVLLATLVLGAVTLARRDAPLAAYGVSVIVGGTLAIVLARPAMVSHGLVLARYCQPALPVMLGLIACGVDRALSWLRQPLAATGLLATLLLGLFLAGPLPAMWYRPNQFMGHLRFQYDYDDARNPFVTLRPDEPIPKFYRDLAQLPPNSIRLIETPWRIESGFDPQPDYQRVHRQRVLIGLINPLCAARNFGDFPSDRPAHLRQFVHLDRVLAGETRGARYLVVHRRLWALTGQSIDWPDMEACLPTLEAALGPPSYRDDALVVFDLAVRALVAPDR